MQKIVGSNVIIKKERTMLKTCRDPLVYKLIKIQFIKEV